MSSERPAEPMRFRKKPVVIQAMRYTESQAQAVAAWCGGTMFPNQPPYVMEDGSEGFLMIGTREGIMRANLGDWVIRGVAGEFHACKPDIFEATYELA